MDARSRILLAVASLDQASYYDLLTVKPSVTDEALQKAFHRFALFYHPDRHVDDEEGIREACRKIFQRGVEAYTVLRDEKACKVYQQCLAQGRKRLSPEEMERLGRRIPEGQTPRPAVSTFVAAMFTEKGRTLAARIDHLVQQSKWTSAFQALGELETIEPSNPVVRQRYHEVSQLAQRK